MASSSFLIFLHCLWLAVVTASCIGLTVDICFASTSTPSFAGFLFLFWPIWVSLDMYLYGSLCTLLNHMPKNHVLARIVELHNGVFRRPRTGAASLIGLSIVWLLMLPSVLVLFWLFVVFQVPQWWSRWMLQGVPSFVVVPYVLFMCLIMTAAWASCMIWLFVRAIKAWWSVQSVLQDMATEEERQQLLLPLCEDDETIVGDDRSLLKDGKKAKNEPGMLVTSI